MNEEIRNKLSNLPVLGSVPLIYKKCKICGGESRLFDVVDFNKFCSPDPYAYGMSGISVPYYRCGFCDFTFTDMIDDWTIDDISCYIYNRDYIKVDPEYAGPRPVRTAEFMSHALVGCEDLRILDYGSGSGIFSGEMERLGFRFVENYDPFSSPYRPAGLFDIIILSEVMEHVQNPLETFLSIKEMLNDGGAIIIGQNLQPDNILEIRGNWWYIAPRNGHISTYSQTTFSIMAHKAGLIFMDYKCNSGNYSFSRACVRDEIANALKSFGSPVRIVRLRADAFSDCGQYHGLESSDGKGFRWTARSEISWSLDPFTSGRTLIDIPFLMEIESGFAEKCTVQLNGQAIAAKVRSTSLSGGSIVAAIEPSERICNISLITPAPISPRSKCGTPDDRLLGLAIVADM
ncbi:MAG: class I SAM-dependent methyltransferase [Syntrophobacteraceae bacterium]|nr:class I SAM-dependent methyltransferase [Desulfobacteraceae bacterium]